MARVTVERFVKMYGFLGTPAGDRMTADLERLRREVWQEAWEFHQDMHAMPVTFVPYEEASRG